MKDSELREKLVKVLCGEKLLDLNDKEAISNLLRIFVAERAKNSTFLDWRDADFTKKMTDVAQVLSTQEHQGYRELLIHALEQFNQGRDSRESTKNLFSIGDVAR